MIIRCINLDDITSLSASGRKKVGLVAHEFEIPPSRRE